MWRQWQKKKKKKSYLINNHVSKIDLRKPVLDTFVMFNQLLTSLFWTWICWLFEKYYLYDKVGTVLFPSNCTKKVSPIFVWCSMHTPSYQIEAMSQQITSMNLRFHTNLNTTLASCVIPIFDFFHIWDSIPIFLTFEYNSCIWDSIHIWIRQIFCTWYFS